jgi:hypothetical protein
MVPSDYLYINQLFVFLHRTDQKLNGSQLKCRRTINGRVTGNIFFFSSVSGKLLSQSLLASTAVNFTKVIEIIRK